MTERRQQPSPAAGSPTPAIAPAVAWAVLGAGALAAVAAVSADPVGAGGAASQDWPPFVLVAGLLLVGLVAADDGVFDAAGRALDRVATGGLVLFGTSMALVAVVTALLNLDTSVTFLTPVLVAAARHRRRRSSTDLGVPMVYGCLLMSNAASLLLPGSNLTNLIVLGHLHLSGAAFAGRMAPAWLAASAITALVVGLLHRRSFASAGPAPDPAPGAPVGRPGLVGLAGVAVATVLVVALRSPALPVLVTGLLLVGLREATTAVERVERTERATVARATGRRLSALAVAAGGPVLPGLFGITLGAGTLGRAWHGPATLLAHLSAWTAAPVAAVLSVLLNNLPAASLLAARHPPHPFSVLLGLDLGPNLLVTGSLSSILWWQQARRAGARPSARQVSRLGAVAVPLAMAAALVLLVATGTT